MDRIYSSQIGQETGNGVNSSSFSPHNTRSSFTKSPVSPSTTTKPLGFSRRVLSAINNAEPKSEGGVEIVLHSNIVTGKELKQALDSMFPGPQEYSVQLRRDRYRVTLPNHSKDDIQRYVSTR